MSIQAATHIVTPLISLNITLPYSNLSNATAADASTSEFNWPMYFAGKDDNDSSLDHPGFTDPDASRSPTHIPAKTETVVVTLTPSPQATRTTSGFAFAFPTRYLSQVPRGWPYTKYGVGRKKEIATWDLTDGEGKTVAVVRHEVRWFPRPLRIGEGVEGWRSTFVVTGRESLETRGVKPRETMSGVVLPMETKKDGV